MDKSEFTLEEAQAAIDEAHAFGVAVHAHVRGPNGGKDFLKAGGDIVVHGTGMADESFEWMAKNGKYLFPTLSSPMPNMSKELVEAKNSRVIAQMAATAQIHWDSVRRAYKAGVKIALSTDAGAVGVKHGENAQEMFRLREIGMSHFESLRAATSEAANAIGLGDKIGQVKSGYKANLVILKDNPLEKLETVLDVMMVIKAGKVVKDNGVLP